MRFNENLLKQDTLYKKVCDSISFYKNEGRKHKRMNRSLWLTATVISVLVAITSAVDIPIGNEKIIHSISAVLAIILPAVTGYVVLRTPEKLWILETSIRNRLKDLSAEIEFQYEHDKNYDRKEFEKKYLSIMAESNKKWVDIKSGTN